MSVRLNFTYGKVARMQGAAQVMPVRKDMHEMPQQRRSSKAVVVEHPLRLWWKGAIAYKRVAPEVRSQIVPTCNLREGRAAGCKHDPTISQFVSKLRSLRSYLPRATISSCRFKTRVPGKPTSPCGANLRFASCRNPAMGERPDDKGRQTLACKGISGLQAKIAAIRSMNQNAAIVPIA